MNGLRSNLNFALLALFCLVIMPSFAQVSAKGPTLSDAASTLFGDSTVRDFRVYSEASNW